jgi:O-antigen ligase
MVDTATVPSGHPRAGTIRTASLSRGAIAAAVFLGGFVLFEPAPYELLLAGLIPLFFLAGLPLRPSVGPLLVGMLAFAAGGFLSVTQVSPDLLDDGLIYMAVTLFLGLSSVFFAALVTEDWTRIRVIERAYVAAGVLSAAIGILAYFRFLPNPELFLLYGRAKGTFEDPNVFGPFLVLPALILAHRLLTGPISTRPGTLFAFLVLVLGVFLSFSRAAWALLVLTLVLLVMVVSATAPSNRRRLRLLALVAAGGVVLVAVLTAAMSVPAVQELLVQRARLVQEYDGKDGAELGRFARHWVGFRMAVELPLGLGPFEFPRRFVEATHNSYLKALMEYGWLGFAAYMTVIAWTVRLAIPLLFQPRPWQGFAQCVVICFLVHLAVGWLIDTDHWRHFFLMLGLVWGLSAVDAAHRPGRGTTPRPPG